MAKRAFLIVLDSVGIGQMPDAADWGDEGSDTLASIRNHPDFDCPNLKNMGLFNIDGVGGRVDSPRTCYARMREASKGKDTTKGYALQQTLFGYGRYPRLWRRTSQNGQTYCLYFRGQRIPNCGARRPCARGNSV